MSELKYEFQVERLIKQISDEFKYEDYKLVTDYLRHHNNICPSCQNEMKVYNGEVKNVGSVALSILYKNKTFAPHVLCKKCTKNSEREPHFVRSKKAGEIEDYIGSVISELKPK